MATASDFVAHVLDLMSAWGGVSARRMFSGYGLFRGGVMFALIAGDTLYLKSDEQTQPDFATAGMRPFVYTRKRGTTAVALSYWQAPPDLLDDPEAMVRWARRAFATARAAKRPTATIRQRRTGKKPR
jgi:DNA transformation protein